MDGTNGSDAGRDSDPEAGVRELIAALRNPGEVNPGFARALIALLETTLAGESRDAERDDDGEPE